MYKTDKINYDSEALSLKAQGLKAIRYSHKKDPVILFMAYDRQDNNKFISKMTDGLIKLNTAGAKMTPKNISKQTGYSIKEIELNLNEIEIIMDSLGF